MTTIFLQQRLNLLKETSRGITEKALGQKTDDNPNQLIFGVVVCAYLGVRDGLALKESVLMTDLKLTLGIAPASCAVPSIPQKAGV